MDLWMPGLEVGYFELESERQKEGYGRKAGLSAQKCFALSSCESQAGE